jgi:hypothetical protein
LKAAVENGFFQSSDDRVSHPARHVLPHPPGGP